MARLGKGRFLALLAQAVIALANSSEKARREGDTFHVTLGGVHVSGGEVHVANDMIGGSKS